MKLVNPIGKKPVDKLDLKAYACTCSIGSETAPSNAVSGYGHGGCSYCGCACDGGSINYSANSSSALSRVTM